MNNLPDCPLIICFSATFMYSGDSKNSVEKARREIVKLKCCPQVDYDSLLKGNHEVFIELYRFIFCDYSRKLSKHFLRLGYEMTGMPDRKFMETVYRIMRDVFEIRPSITQAQFFSPGFGDRKMDMFANVSAKARELLSKINKPQVQKSAISYNIINPKAFRNAEKDPEIIEINTPRMLPKSRLPLESIPSNSYPVEKPRERSLSNEENRVQINSREKYPLIEVSSTYQPYFNNETKDDIRSVSRSERSTAISHSDSETQTCKADTMLEICSKLENITARLTILEMRMSRVEEKNHCDTYEVVNGRNLSNQYFSGSKPLPALVTERKDSHKKNFKSDNSVKPVEAVILDLSNQPPSIDESVTFHDLPKNEADASVIENLRNPPRHYSPALYRQSSNDRIVSEKSSDEDDSSVSSNFDDSSEKVFSLPPRSPQNEKGTDTILKESCDSFQSQINRIQEMIENTNMMLNPSTESMSV